MIESCAIAHYPNATQWFPFLYCLEMALPNLLDNVQACAQKTGLDYDTINTCFTGPEGYAVEHAAAVETENLKPPHQFVPWVVIDGVWPAVRCVCVCLCVCCVCLCVHAWL